MALQHLRSSTANKRPLPAGMSDGQLAVNTNLGSPGLFFKDSNGDLVKVGPVHVGATAPNASPAAGGATGNTKGEQWLDTSGTNPVLKVWDGSAWQSEAGEFVNASGDTMTGALVMDNQQQVRFRETTANGTNYVAIQAPASVGADRTLTLPDVSGTIVSTGDTGTVTSTMIADGTIVNGDINASAAIAGTKISPDFGSQTVTTTGVISAAAGAEGTPSIAFTGDTNTGLYSPGADQVAISTGGSGRLFVNAGGDVGVRSAAVGFPLEVRSRSTTDSAQVGLTALNWSTNYSSTYLQLFDTAATGSTFGISNANSGQLVFQNHANAIIGTNNATPIIFATQSSERLRITSAGLVGVGTSSPSELLHVSKDQNAITAIKVTNPNTGASAASYLSLESGTKNVAISAYNAGSSFQIQGFGGIVTQYQDFDTHIWRNNAGTERARIDSSGRLLVGTSSAPAPVAGFGSNAIQVVNQSAYAGIVNLSTSNDAFGPHFSFGKSRGGTSTIVQNNDNLGSIRWGAADGTDVDTAAALIEAYVDGTPGANDMPGRLVFSTTADAASSPTERMRITNGGFTKLTNDGTYYNSTGGFHEARTTSNDASLIVTATNATYTKEALRIFVTKAANSDWWFADYWSGVTTDREFQFRGDGNAFADGTWTGGGADYAEYFEWADSNPDAEDRRGISVVLDGNKIREAQAGEDPIGVISGNPSVVGDAAWNKWSGKYLRDEFGTYIQEDYEVTDDDGNTVTQQRRKLNPAYDPDVEYTSREERPEWDCVGLMGKLRLRKGQPTGSRWIKMRDISDSVEEWLVR